MRLAETDRRRICCDRVADGEVDDHASALTSGYQLAYLVGAALVAVAIAIALTVLRPGIGAAHEDVEREVAEAESAYSEAA